MLLPEPRVLKFIKLTAGSQTRPSLPPAARALIVYALVAGHEPGDYQTANPGTALTVRRKHAIFCIRSRGSRPTSKE